MSIGSFISGIFGSTNDQKATAPKVDANAFQYGGAPGGADAAANRYAQMAQQAQGRTGAQANYTQANSDYYRGLQARDVQDQATQAMLRRAMGQTPSIAQMAGNRAMQQAAAEQASQAASARGAAGLALAQQTAANNTANAQGQIGGQTAVAAAQERLQAEQAAAQAGAQLRGGDLASQGLSAQQAQYQATNEMQQRALNNQMTLGMTGNEIAVRNAQLAASQNQQALQSGNQMQAQQINAGVGGQNAAMNQQNSLGLVGLVSSGAGGVAGGFGGGKAKGGPVHGGTPYLVGEKGPELVVPKHDGVVIPAHITAALLGRSQHRADGGPVAAGQSYQVGEQGPEMVVPQVAPSTWGVGGPAVADQNLAYQQAATAEAQNQSAIDQANAYKDPYQQVIERERAGRAAGLDQSEADAQEERYARYMLGRAKKDAGKPSHPQKADDAKEKADVVAGKAAPRSSLSRAVGGAFGGVGGTFQNAAGSVDVGYHGPTGYVPPQLIPIGARAGGGPVAGGSPYMVGEQGPELVVPQVAHVSSGPTSLAMQGTFGAGAEQLSGGGGMNPMMGVQWNNRELGGMRHMPMRISGMREEGGPVQKGKAYVVGERGAEAVVPAKNPQMAQAWDAGQTAAAADTQKLSAMPPAQLHYIAKSGGPHAALAQSILQVKGDAWDEGHKAATAEAAKAAPAPAPAQPPPKDEEEPAVTVPLSTIGAALAGPYAAAAKTAYEAGTRAMQIPYLRRALGGGQ